MKLSKNLKTFLEEARKTDTYWVEHAKLEFSLALEVRRRSAKMTYADIADKIKTSAAYITKVFRGDSNMTIESMVKLARATGGQLDIRIIDRDAAIDLWDLSDLAPKADHVSFKLTSTVTYVNFPAANSDQFEWGRCVA